MRTTTRINIVLSFLALLFMSLNVSGQTAPDNFQPHGVDSNGDSVATENTEYVTVGDTIPYFAMPDSNISPSYDFQTDPSANLNSTFQWSTTAGHAYDSIESSNYINVYWDATNGTGSYVLWVKEMGLDGGCVDPDDSTEINVTVINPPSVEFNYAVSGSSEEICATGTNGSLGLTADTIELSTTNEVPAGITDSLEVTYRIEGPGITTHETTVDVSTANEIIIPETLDEYGDYTFTITNITDKISRKNPNTVVPGNLLTDLTYSIYVNRTPNTGVIYHLPNQ